MKIKLFNHITIAIIMSTNCNALEFQSKIKTGKQAAQMIEYYDKITHYNNKILEILNNTTDKVLYDYAIDVQITILAKLLPKFKSSSIQPVKTTLVNPLTDRIKILHSFIHHAITKGQEVNYRFPEMTQFDIQSNEQHKTDVQECSVVTSDGQATAHNLETQPMPTTLPSTQSHPAGFTWAKGVEQTGGFKRKRPTTQPFTQYQLAGRFGFGQIKQGSTTQSSAQSNPPTFGQPAGRFGFVQIKQGPTTQLSAQSNPTTQSSAQSNPPTFGQPAE